MDFVAIASGPSLTPEDCELVRQWRTAGGDRRIIVANLAWKAAPFADYLYAADLMFWEDGFDPATGVKYREDVFQNFKGALYTTSALAAGRYGIKREVGLGLTNSGIQCVALAARMGAMRIVMLGYDYGLGPNGEVHFHADHPAPLDNGNKGRFETKEVARLATELASKGVQVVNCSRRSALTCFPVIPLEAALAPA